MARRRGRAWGNALGGYKRQRRDSKGRFASGSVGGRTKSRVNRAKKRYKSRGGKTATRVRAASKQKYNKANLNKQLQRNHRATIAGRYVGLYGGYAAGTAIGASMAGPYGAMMGSAVGQTIGMSVASTTLRKRGQLVTDRDFMKAGKDDQAAMARRIKRYQRAHTAISVAEAVYGTHKATAALNGYGVMAAAIKKRKGQYASAASRGIPRTGSAQRYARAGRFGKNKGVYNISSMGPVRPFM